MTMKNNYNSESEGSSPMASRAQPLQEEKAGAVLGKYIFRSSIVIAVAIVLSAFVPHIGTLIQNVGWYLPFLGVCLVVYTIVEWWD